MSKKTIFFRVDGDDGSSVGLGHLNRVVKIFFQIKKKYKSKFNYVFISKNYMTGIKFLKDKIKTKPKIIYYSQLNKLQIKEEDIFIIDTLGIEKKLSQILKKNKVKKVLSFDETKPSRINSGVIINGIFFAKKKLKKIDKIKVYQGSKFIVLDEKFSLNKINKNQKLFNKILVTSGGSDKKKMMFRVIKKILNFKECKNIISIVGSGVDKKNPLFKLKNKKVHFIKRVANIKSLLNQCSIAICSGGTVMFESIASGLKPFVIQTYTNQKYAIDYFNRKKAIIKIANIDNKNFEDILYRKLSQHDFNKNDHLINRDNKLVDGKGLLRVTNIIYKFIN